MYLGLWYVTSFIHKIQKTRKERKKEMDATDGENEEEERKTGEKKDDKRKTNPVIQSLEQTEQETAKELKTKSRDRS